ncbi:hypothetical protein K2X05_08945, partial [bacterium]|nr:hypothetical protein [bacterium]
PRIYRQMLFKNMKSYFLDPSNNPAALNKAAYWYKLWATTFPDEEKSSADGYEGTAKYVEEISKIYADKKCTANTNEVFQKLSNLVSSDMYTYKKPTFRLDAEGYAFGSLAGFILSYKENNSSWFSEMSLGKTPIDILLDNRTPTFEPADTNLEKNYVDEAKIANDQVDQMLGPSLQDFTNKSFVRIVLTGSFASYSPKGFFLPKQLPDVSAVPLAVELNINTSYSIITIKKDTVLFSLENPCDKTKFTALVPEKDFIIQNGSVLLQSNGLNGKLRGSLVTDKNGYSWFCGVP